MSVHSYDVDWDAKIEKGAKELRAVYPNLSYVEASKIVRENLIIWKSAQR